MENEGEEAKNYGEDEVEELKNYGIDVNNLTEERYKPVVLIYGKKGSGKTTSLLAFPGSILALSFDGQTAIIKEMLGREDVRVFDIAGAVSHLEPLLQGVEAINLAKHILTHNKADWVLLDGIEMLNMFAERKMRYNNQLTLSQGFKERNIWKERNAYIDQIHNLSVKNSEIGVLYTTFETVQEEGAEDEVKNEIVPKYVSRMMWASNIVLHIVAKHREGKNSYFVHVDSDKGNMLFKTGDTINVTNYHSLLPIEKFNSLRMKMLKPSKLGGEEKNEEEVVVEKKKEEVAPSEKNDEKEEEVVVEKKEVVVEKKKEIDDVLKDFL